MQRRHALIPLFILSLAACGEDPNALEGSASAYFDLTFDEVSVATDSSALSIIYRRTETGEVALRLTLDTTGLDLRNAVTIAGHTFKDRVNLERVTLAEDEFAPIDGGQIYFEKFSLQPGETVEGAFEMVLEGGLTLSGRFASNVIDEEDSRRRDNPSGEPLSG